MTTESFEFDNSETNERLRRLISRAIGPDDQTDEEIERMLDEVSPVAMPDEQVTRILGGVFGQAVAPTDPPEGRESLAASRFPIPQVARPKKTPDTFHIKNRIAKLDALPRKATTVHRQPVQRPASIGKGALAAVFVSAMSLLVACFVAPQPQSTKTSNGPLSGSAVMVMANSVPDWFATLQRQATRLVAAPVRATKPMEPVQVGDVIETGSHEKRRLHLPDGSVLYVNEATKVTVEDARRIKIDAGEVFVEVVPEFDDAQRKQHFVVETATRKLTALGTKFGVETRPNETDVVVTQGLVDVGGTQVPAGQQAVIVADDLLINEAPRASHSLWWTEDLMTAAAAAIVPESEYLGGRLISIDPNGQEMQLSLRKYHIDVHIEDGFARTTIDQTYFNHTGQRLEGTFYFPLPADASLSRLAMYVGEKLMEGGMAEREHARNVFEEIRHTKRDPALLEWVDGTTFKMRVFPLEARQEKRLVLSYTQRLNSAYGKTHYRFPAGHNMDVVRDWSTRITAKNAADREWNSPSHRMKNESQDGNLILTAEVQNSTMDRDIVLELTDDWVVNRKQPRRAADRTRLARAVHEDHQYLMVRHRPKLTGEQQRPQRRWVILFEASGDRDPVLARTQIEVIRTFLQNAEHKDQFAIVTAGSKARMQNKEFSECSAQNIATSIEALEETQLIGALDLEAALIECDKLYELAAGGPGETVLVHVGSGLPVLGVTEENKLAKLVPTSVRYVGLGIGRRWSRQFMKQAAAKTGGYFTQINPDEKVAWRAFETFSVLNAPRLLNLTVTDEAGSRRFRNWTDSIADGEEVCAITRLAKDAKLPPAIVVRGEMNGKPWQVKIPIGDSDRMTEQADYLPRSWAKLEIDRLVAEGAAAHKQPIIELSKAMYVMSPFTSLLVLENEQMYAQYKVDRGRKDHWALYPCPDTIKVVNESGAPTPQQTETENLAESVLPAGPLSLSDAVGSVVDRPTPQWIRWLVPFSHNQDGRPIAWRYGNSHGNSQIRNWGRTEWFTGLGVDSNAVELFNSPAVWDVRGNASFFLWDGSVRSSPQGLSASLDSSQLDSLAGARIRGMDGYLTERDFRNSSRLSEAELLKRRDEQRAFVKLQLPNTNYDAWTKDFDDDGGIPQTSEFERPASPTVTKGLDRLNRYRLVIPSFDQSVWMSSGSTHTLNIPFDSMPLAGKPVVTSFGTRLGTRGVNAGPEGVVKPWGFARELGQQQIRFLGSDVDLLSALVDLQPQEQQVRVIQLRHDPARIQRKLQEAFADAGINIDSSRSSLDSGIRRRIPFSTLADPNVADEFVEDWANPIPFFTLADPIVVDPFGEDGIDLSYTLGRGGRFYEQLVPARGLQPQFGAGRDVFGDLVAYAPGMHVSRIDRLAVVESETKSREVTHGSIDKAARRLIDAARARGWEQVTVGEDDGLTIQANGAGHFAWKRTLPEGLGETVVCDGQSIRHLYREIGLGAKRTNSRFHQAAFRRLIPWLVASAAELARDANVTARGRTVVVTPIIPDKLIKDGQRPDVVELHMMFDAESRLTERRYVMNDKVLLRQTYGAAGNVKTFDTDDRVVAETNFHRTDTGAPDLKPATDGLVVMPLPYRSVAAVRRELQKPDTAMKDWDAETALSMLGAYIAQSKSKAAVDLLKQRFFDQGDDRIGLTVLLGTRFPGAMYNGKDIDLRPGVERSPLAQFMRQFMTWSQSTNNNTEFAIDGDQNGFVQRMATARNLYHRWSAGLVTKDRTQNQIQVELRRTLEFIATCDSRLGWTLLSVIQPRVKDPELNSLLADAASRFVDSPQLAWLAKSARIRSLFIAGENGKARREYRELLFDSLRAGRTPMIETDLQQSFRNRGNGPHLWRQLCRDMQDFVIEHKLLRTAVQLSIRLRQLRFEDAADEMLTAALKELDVQQRPDVAGLAIGQLNHLQRFNQADELISPLLELPYLQFDSGLWRYAADLAKQRGKKKLALERLERALALEFQFRPDVIDLQKLRTDYGDLLSQYEAVADAAATLGQDPPPDLAARVIAAADRWRMLDDNDTPSCNAAATILTKLGQRDQAWNYLTTPLATNPGDSQTWVAMARHLRKDNDYDRAHLAFDKAWSFEQTNPDILLEHARSLRRHGETAEARQLFEKIASGSWQPRFANTKKEAQRVLNEMN